MIHAFKPIDHPLQALHGHVMHLVLEVWCQGDAWSPDRLKPEFRELIDAVDQNKKPANRLMPRLACIHALCTELGDASRALLAEKCRTNNDVEALCCNCETQPMRYADLEPVSAPLADALNDLFKDLYTDILKAKPVEDKYGSVKNHYDAFLRAQGSDMCPFCGLVKLQTEDHSVRDAYDHYLPKGTYPFNSINFKQLVPMCPRCNSQYKLAKDPLYDAQGTRRKAFYPFACPACSFSIGITLPAKAVDDLSADDVQFDLSSATHTDEVATWNDVFGLDERYRAECASSTGGKHWAKEILNYANRMKGVTVEMVYNATLENARDKPGVAQNFLKVPFLEACERVGVFTEYIT